MVEEITKVMPALTSAKEDLETALRTQSDPATELAETAAAEEAIAVYMGTSAPCRKLCARPKASKPQPSTK